MHEKVILSYEEQVKFHKHKGVTFDHGYNEEEARTHLEVHNNLFRLKAYLKNFKDFGSATYRGIDFSYLVYLSEIDLPLKAFASGNVDSGRTLFKIHLLYLVTEHYPDEKAYELVKEYYRSLDTVSKDHIDSMLFSYSQSPHTCGLFDKYVYESMGKNVLIILLSGHTWKLCPLVALLISIDFVAGRWVSKIVIKRFFISCVLLKCKKRHCT